MPSETSDRDSYNEYFKYNDAHTYKYLHTQTKWNHYNNYY